jgi:colanic acid/amylovoran biosynthesis glycosyltransferase
MISNVLIITASFPEISETFIRDHLRLLLNGKVSAYIISRKSQDFSSKAWAFEDAEKVKNVSYNEENIIPTNKLIRGFRLLLILLRALLNGHLSYYWKLFKKKPKTKFGYALSPYFILDFLLVKNITVIHCHFANNLERYDWVKDILPNLKLIVTFHGYDLRNFIKSEGLAYGKSLNKCDAIVAISNFTKQNLLRLGLPENKIFMIPNSVPLLYKERQIETQTQDEPLKIVSVSRLVPLKNLRLAIEAIYLLKEKGNRKNLIFQIVGNGEQKEELLQLIEEKNLSESVFLLGDQSSKTVYNLLKDAHIFLHTSLKENLPVAILEGMSCGLPIIACETGGIAEIVSNENGFLIAHNKVIIAETLMRLIASPDLRKKLGDNGHSLIKEKFSQNKVFEQFIHLYSN